MPRPIVTVSRSHRGPVYAGTTFKLRVNISFTDMRADVSLDTSWKQQSTIGNTVMITSDTRTTVSAVSGSGDSYTAFLTYSPIIISDSGNITATVTVSLPDESMCVYTEVSDVIILHVEGN